VQEYRAKTIKPFQGKHLIVRILVVPE